jgi:hypothetical protein
MPTIDEYKSLQFEVDRNIVQRALRNALKNGYEVATLPASLVAIDLTLYESELENYDPREIVQHVRH